MIIWRMRTIALRELRMEEAAEPSFLNRKFCRGQISRVKATGYRVTAENHYLADRSVVAWLHPSYTCGCALIIDQGRDIFYLDQAPGGVNSVTGLCKGEFGGKNCLLLDILPILGGLGKILLRAFF